VSDLERLFHRIVVNLAAIDPARLRQSLSLVDLRNSIVPYRANRRALQLESSEDYELAIMRLCAGEGGFAHTDPGEAQAEFDAELRSPNPDLTIVQRHEKAVLSLNPEAVTKAMEAESNLAFAPREYVPKATREPRVSRKAAPDRREVESPTPHCRRCGGALPVDRVVNFCPQCGQNLARLTCPQCNTELEVGWKHCVSCGTPVTSR
jgi:predicted RNA-binding Zn-ribbon protein involved in translation (DUF1610 family)